MFRSEYSTAALDNRLRPTASRGEIVRQFLAMPNTWRCRIKSRRELSQLDADQLRDVGLEASVIRQETEKPFWRE